MHADPAAVIVASGLSKTYWVTEKEPGFGGAVRSLLRPRRAPRIAVDDVSFRITRGEIVGYLGPNGAGKSTTIKMLCGVLLPTRGMVRVAGIDPARERIRNAARIGAVFGQRTQLWWDLPAVESLRILQAFYGISGRTFDACIAAFDPILDLRSFWRTPVRQLSLGQRMRCDLAAAMLHDPEVLYLDEPTVGMDVLAKEHVRQFLQYLVAERQTTILLTTHDMRDVERLCDRVLLIDRGRLSYEGTVEELKRQEGAQRVLRVRFGGPEAPDHPRVAGATLTEQSGPWAAFRLDEGQNPHAVLAHLAQEYPVEDLTLEEPSLEDVLRNLYRQDGTGGHPPDKRKL